MQTRDVARIFTVGGLKPPRRRDQDTEGVVKAFGAELRRRRCRGG